MGQDSWTIARRLAAAAAAAQALPDRPAPAPEGPGTVVPGGFLGGVLGGLASPVGRSAPGPGGGAAPLPDPAEQDSSRMRHLRQQAGEVLVDLYRYLDQHAAGRPSLAPAVTALRDAVLEHRARPADPLRGPRAVCQAIEAVRRTDPSLPQP